MTTERDVDEGTPVVPFAEKSPTPEVRQTKSAEVVSIVPSLESGVSSAVSKNKPALPWQPAVKRGSKNYFSLPINKKLKQRARELRKAGNLSEVLFWNQVKRRQFRGFDFDRQKIIGNYIVDFYCTNCNVVIEIDGSSHNGKEDYDAKRDEYLESLGLTVIHIPVTEVMNNLNGVMEMLYKHPALLECHIENK